MEGFSLAGTTAAPSATGPCTCMLRQSELAFAVATWPDAIPHIGTFISLCPSVGDPKAPFRYVYKCINKVGVIACTYKRGTWKTETGES